MTRRERICKGKILRRVGIKGHRAASLGGVAVCAWIVAHQHLVRVQGTGRAGLAILAVVARIAFACMDARRSVRSIRAVQKRYGQMRGNARDAR